MKNLAALLLFVLALLPSTRAAEDTTDVAATIGDRPATAILRTMPSDTPANQRLAGLTFIGGYEAIGQPTPISPAQASRLAALVQGPGAFDSSEPEAKMRPGVAYRFGTGADTVDLLVCFSCDKVAIVQGGAIISTLHIPQPTRDVLLGLARELLPNDEAIQELPTIRSEHAIPPPYAPLPKDTPGN